ncbi:MAG: hypothetical protein P1U39_07885 [Legionellaceae bacterium]|nr:hypothetical protein [Legionellaceae bacterium]
MFFCKKTTMSLYITHGSPLVMKGVARTHSQHEPHLIVICSYLAGEKIYGIKNIDPLIIKITQAGNKNREKLVHLAQHHQQPLTQTEFNSFIHEIKTYFKINHINLCADGNLFHGNTASVSDELCDLVQTLKPQSLFLFSETPECVEDARNYLNRRLTNNHVQLPRYRLNGAATSRQYLAEIIRQEKINPTMIPVHRGCLDFFSQKKKYRDATVVPEETTPSLTIMRSSVY